MKFEFEYTEEEKAAILRLNKIEIVSRTSFFLIILGCFLPSILAMVALENWTVLKLAVGVVVVSGIASTMEWLRREPHSKPAKRSFEFTRTGKMESIGTTETMVKWDLVDGIEETPDWFAFERLGRISILPKRAIDQNFETGSQAVDEVRDFLKVVRNVPENGHVSLQRFDELMAAEGLPAYTYIFSEEDLVASVAPMLEQIKEGEFSPGDIKRVIRSTRRWQVWGSWALVLPASCFLAVIIFASGELVSILTLVAMILPFCLLLIWGLFRKSKAKKNLPRVPRDVHRFRMLSTGWFVGEPNAVSFHEWNSDTWFYVSKTFIGIRSDSKMVNLIPNDAFYPEDNRRLNDSEKAEILYEVIRTAMALRRAHMISVEKVEGRNVVEPIESGNPYQSPGLG